MKNIREFLASLAGKKWIRKDKEIRVPLGSGAVAVVKSIFYRNHSLEYTLEVLFPRKDQAGNTFFSPIHPETKQHYSWHTASCESSDAYAISHFCRRAFAGSEDPRFNIF